jgi:hypothetical protein
LAFHAAINAADAVGGIRAAGEDHGSVLALLRQAGTDGIDIEKDLRRLWPLKTENEYEPDDVGLRKRPRRSSVRPAAPQSPFESQRQFDRWNIKPSGDRAVTHFVDGRF